MKLGMYPPVLPNLSVDYSAAYTLQKNPFGFPELYGVHRGLPVAAANAGRLLGSIADADQDKLTERAIVAVAKPR
jgi:hypothetical protein